jgi:hypothetical protein
VILKRFLALLLVFIFGMTLSYFRARRCAGRDL